MQYGGYFRRIARLQWALLLDFEEGFDQNMKDMLQQYYPKSLMSELSCYMHHSLMDLYNAFPSRKVCPTALLVWTLFAVKEGGHIVVVYWYASPNVIQSKFSAVHIAAWLTLCMLLYWLAALQCGSRAVVATRHSPCDPVVELYLGPAGD